MSMSELDLLFSLRYWSKRFSPDEIIKHHLEFIGTASEITRKKIPSRINIPYGETERQKIDIFGTDLSEGAPILIFLHGGYWRTSTLSRSSYHFMAENLHRHNIRTIFVGYDLCPEVTLPQIVNQTEKATEKCLKYAKETKSRGMYFMGHSAGAHLFTFLFTNFIKSLPPEDQSIIKGVFSISGVFDLSQLQKTVINDSLKLNEEDALKMSPLELNVSDGAGTAFYFFVGQNESPEFIRQSEKFREKLKGLGIKTQLSIIENVDHFEIMEKLAEEDYEITRRIIEVATKE